MGQARGVTRPGAGVDYAIERTKAMNAPTERDTPRRRGEAAWKADRDAVADRNDAARKAGRDERRAAEQRADEARRAADLRERAAVAGKGGGR